MDDATTTGAQTMTSQSLPTFRKAQNGKWVAFGPTSRVRVGEVTVEKRDGSTKQVTVESLGRPFDVDGVKCVYGYISSERRSSRNSTYGRGHFAPGGRRCPYCGSRSCARAWNPNDLCDED
jgi:hypothetical protein